MSQTRQIDRFKLEEAIGRTGIDSEQPIRDDYSGRAMFGESCFGVVYDSEREAFELIAALAEVAAESGGDLAADSDESAFITAMELAEAAKTDSMGRSGIVYFVGFTVESDEG